MESECSPPSTNLRRCCDCDCNCSSLVMKKSLSGMCLRSVKRKYDPSEEENRFTIPGLEVRFTIPGLEVPQNPRVVIGNECIALRETVSSQQKTIQNLLSELEEERNASSSAANEAMSMILRLQRDKAEIQMEAKQFKRFAEEKMSHDQLETLALEDLLYRREEVIQALTCELQAYKHRLMSYGLTETEADGFLGVSRNSGMIEDLQSEFPHGVYPPLKCYSNESHAYSDGEDETPDVDKYAFREISCSGDRLKDLEGRISLMESSPITIQPDGELNGVNSVLEKVIDPGSLSAVGAEIIPNFTGDPLKLANGFKEFELSYIEVNSDSTKVDDKTEIESELGDRICTIDSVYPGSSINGTMDPKTSDGVGCDECVETPRELLNRSNGRELEIQKLYARLHALEADRESMRQAVISMGTKKAQMVLLKEIAQNFSYEMSLTRRIPVRKQVVAGIYSFMAIFKWIIPLIFWRRKVQRCRYTFGISSSNVGLLVLLDRGPRVGEWRRVSCRDTSRTF